MNATTSTVSGMTSRLFWLAFSAMVCLIGCDAPQARAGARTDASADATKSPSRDVANADQFHEFSLTIYGYNYTDTEIGSFEVNGRGGGNLAVSTPTAGGGKSACCTALFTPLPKANTIRIKWTRDGDTWCEQDVPFMGPVPANAEYMEVHFYRDGIIGVAVTPTSSPPRVRLERLHGNSRHFDRSLNINNDDKHSRCKLGYR